VWYDVVLFNYYEQFMVGSDFFVIIGKTFFNKRLDVMREIDETFGGRKNYRPVIMKTKDKPEGSESSQATIDSVCAILKDGATTTTTNPREGGEAIEYWHVPISLVEQLGELATLREKASDYASIIVRAFDVKSKTIQTTIEKGDSTRKDTLSLDEKKVRFDKWIDVLFTKYESEATVAKRVMSSMKELVVALKKAQAEGDVEAIAQITSDMTAAMLGGKA
jgi:hypothetical protein